MRIDAPEEKRRRGSRDGEWGFDALQAEGRREGTAAGQLPAAV
jgi:hypothetical protein